MVARKVRIVVGILVWIFALGWIGTKYVPGWFGGQSATSQAISSYVLGKPKVRELAFESSFNIRIGDPIFCENDQGKLVQVGAIRQCESPESQEYEMVYTDWATAKFFSTAPNIEAGDYLTFHQTPASMDWVAKFLFPPERQAFILDLVSDVYTAHSEEVMEQLMPILQTAWNEASLIIRDELLKSLANHKAEFENLAARYRTEIFDEQVLPVLGDEVWPIVQQEAKPVLELIGKQIWEEASVFRFGWRALYDASPLPQRDLTQAEFSRFVSDEAVPVLTENLPLFMETQQAILQKVVANKEVQKVAISNLERIGKDPELQGILLSVLKESILENEVLHNAMYQVFQKPEFKELMELTDARLEPAVVEIGEEVFGSPYSGVTPEFARILRNKILLKDERWLILHRSDEEAPSPFVTESEAKGKLALIRGHSTMENPFYYPARQR